MYIYTCMKVKVYIYIYIYIYIYSVIISSILYKVVKLNYQGCLVVFLLILTINLV